MIGLYFSGTGNTKHCIEMFLSELGAGYKTCSIEDCDSVHALEKERDIVLAYPVYFSNIPKILDDYICRNGGIFRGKRVFLIATMGLFSGDGAGCAARKLKKHGAIITGGLHVKMPDCIGDVKLLKKTLAANRRIIGQAEEKCRLAAAEVRIGNPPREGLSVFSHIAGLLGQRLWFLHKTRRYSDKLKINPALCNGCGVCETACPMKNIRLLGGKAISGDSCTMCYRCVGHCPSQAITLLGERVVEQCRIEKYLDA